VTLAVDLVFIAQVLVLAGILVWRRARIGVGLAIWLGVLAVLAGQGYFLDFQSMPPRLTLAGLLPLVAGLLMLPTHGTRHFLAVTPPERLIYLQSFRIVMEIILWALAVQGRAPKLMTFEGRNIDILVGLTAIPIGWMVVERRAWPVWVAAAWNVVGILILANVVIHAQLALRRRSARSSPSHRRRSSRRSPTSGWWDSSYPSRSGSTPDRSCSLRDGRASILSPPDSSARRASFLLTRLACAPGGLPSCSRSR